MRDWRQHNAGRLPLGIRALGLGYVCVVCCALPQRHLRIPKGHEILALSAFFGLCIGVVHLTFHAIDRGFRQRSPRLGVSNRRLVASLLSALALLPISLAVAAPVYVSMVFPGLPWVNLEWRARGIPVYLSFAYWEWITCVVFSIYIVCLYFTAGQNCAWTRTATIDTGPRSAL
jgi:hypothetical protein